MHSERRAPDSRHPAHIGGVIFVVLFACYGYFYQGGGWNQNSRFDQIRAIVERQELEINDYLAYQAVPTDGGEGRVIRLLNAAVDTNLRFANSLDISRFAGKVYPNKPPGTVFLALPAYGFIYQLETFLGLDADDWWMQSINLYFTTVFSVGLITALGGVVFFFLSRRLFPELPLWIHLAATFAYGLGTLILPFATLLFDHNLVATLSLCAFGLLFVENQGGSDSLRPSMAYFLAGLFCGLSVVVNYAAILTAACVFFYGLGTAKKRLMFFLTGLAGSLVPIISLLTYHAVCFGAPFATANSYQYEMFRSGDAVLFGMFAMPSPTAAYKLLFSAYRGLFFTSPALFLAPLGLWFLLRERGRSCEALLFTAIFAANFLMNSSFNLWHAGWTFGPRYLIPALPFLALSLPGVFSRLPRLAVALSLLSIAVMLLMTATDPQVPNAIKNPLFDYGLKLAEGARIQMQGIIVEGPVSANPIGVYESWDHPARAVSPTQRRWHSFNLGEFIWPSSWLSLLPLMIFLGGGIVHLIRAQKNSRDNQ